MKVRVMLAALAAINVVTPAVADQSWSNSIAPRVSLGLSFGGDAQRTPSQLSARFDLRSNRLHAAPASLHAPIASDDPRDVIANGNGLALVNVFELSATRKGVDSMQVLWHDMLRSSDQLNEDGTSESGGGHRWIWWTAGAIVATGAALAAAGGASGNADNSPTGNNGGNNGNNGNCGVSGDVIGPDPLNVDTSSCGGVGSGP